MTAGMDARLAQRIEGVVTVASAAILAAAVAFAVGQLSPSKMTAGAAAAAALFGTLLILRSIGPGVREYPIAQFMPAALAFEDCDELILTDADQLDLGGIDELLLDDVLVSPDGESRVVRLFDASAMPTPGELKSQIDRHLGRMRGESGLPDASAALHEALAELRHSLK